MFAGSSFARFSRSQTQSRSLTIVALIALTCFAAIIPASAQKDRRQERFFYPGNLVVSRSVYDNNPNNVTAGELLPPNCPAASGTCGTAPGAPFNGTYPLVW